MIAYLEALVVVVVVVMWRRLLSFSVGAFGFVLLSVFLLHHFTQVRVVDPGLLIRPRTFYY